MIPSRDLSAGAQAVPLPGPAGGMLPAGLARRAAFADAARLRLDRLRLALGRPRGMADIQWLYYAAVMGFDSVEALRSLRPVDRPMRPHMAALDRDAALDQTPEYRAYWYDADRHAMVGSFVGLDLHRHDGRYYCLESNLTAGLMPERRALYDADGIDPFITGLLGVAQRHGFRRIVLQRRSWRAEHRRECARAAQAHGIPITLSSTMAEPGDAPVNPAVGLPRDLARDTMYVVFTAISESAIYQMLHQKVLLDRWLPRALDQGAAPHGLLAAVPGADGPSVPSLSDDPRWPNLVVKLANSDEGRDILFGRFTSEAAARAALGLPETGQGVPRQFLRGPVRQLAARLAPHAMTAVYQSFVPPEDADGYPRMMRMEAFLSPLEDTFLSAHGTIGGDPIPHVTEPDTVLAASPLNVSVPPGRFIRLDAATETDLARVAQDFGACARHAITRQFRTGPAGGAR